MAAMASYFSKLVIFHASLRDRVALTLSHHIAYLNTDLWPRFRNIARTDSGRGNASVKSSCRRRRRRLRHAHRRQPHPPTAPLSPSRRPDDVSIDGEMRLVRSPSVSQTARLLQDS